MAGQSNTYALQMVLDMTDTLEKLRAAHQAFAQFSEPQTAKIDVKVDVAEAERKLSDLNAEFVQLREKIDGIQKQHSAMTAKLAEEIAAIEKVMPGLGDAFTKEAKEMQAVAKELAAKMSALPEDVREDVAASAVEIRRLKDELKSLGASASSVYNTGIRTLGKARGYAEVVSAQAPAPAPSAPNRRTQKYAEDGNVSSAKPTKTSGSGGGETPNTEEFVKEMRLLREALSNLKVTLDPKDLVTKIDAALSTHHFKLGIDGEHIVTQVRTALAAAAPFAIGVGTHQTGPVNAASAAVIEARTAAIAAADARTERKQKEEEDRAEANASRRRRTKEEIERDEAMKAARAAAKGRFVGDDSVFDFLGGKGGNLTGQLGTVRQAFGRSASELAALGPTGVQELYLSAEKAFLGIRNQLKKDIADLNEGGKHLEAAEHQAALDYLYKTYRGPLIENQRALRERNAALGRRIIDGYDPNAVDNDRFNANNARHELALRKFGRGYNADWDEALRMEAKGIRTNENSRALAEMLQRKFDKRYNDAWDAAIAEGKRRDSQATASQARAQREGMQMARILRGAQTENDSRDFARQNAAYGYVTPQQMLQQARELDRQYERQQTINKKRAAYDAGRRGDRDAIEADAYREDARRFSNGPNGPNGPSRRPSRGSLGGVIRNGLALFGGVNLAYTSYNAIRNAVKQYEEYDQQIAEIQATMRSKNPFDAQNLSAQIGKTAVKYGVSLTDAAEAAKTFAHAGLDAKEVVGQLDRAFASAKGIGLSIQQAQDLQLAIRAVTTENERFAEGVDYTAAVMDKVSVVESHYAVSATDLASAIKILTPLMNEFSNGMSGLNDVFDYTNAVTTVMVEKLRITGSQAANVTKIILSRLTRPETLKNLQQHFGVELQNKDTGDYLPIDQIINQLGQKYASLDPTKRKAFATELSGGRNVHAAVALLEDYARVGEIATVSASSFGDAQKRAAITTDTLQTAVGKLRTEFTLFTKNMAEGTGFATGLRAAVDGLSATMGVFAGAGGLGALLAVISGGTLFGGLKALHGWLRGIDVAAKAATAGTATLGQSMVAFFSPTGVILTGLTAILVTVGLVIDHYKRLQAEQDRYAVKAAKLTNIESTPQYNVFKNTAQSVGLIRQDASFEEVKGGYSNILGYLKDDRFAPLRTQIQKFGKMTDDELAKAFAKEPQTFTQFQKDFTKIFISTLPEAVRKGFDAMEKESDRVKAVMNLVGGAATTAMYQMRSAIEDMHASVNRMMDDTMSKLEQMEKAKRDPSFWQRIFGVSNLYDNIGQLPNNERSKKIVLGELINKSSEVPEYSAIFANKDLTSYFEKSMLNGSFMKALAGGKAGTQLNLLDAGVSQIMADPAMRQQYLISLWTKTGDWRSLAHAPDSVLNASGLGAEALQRINSVRQRENISKFSQDEFSTWIRGQNPELDALDKTNRVYQRGGTPVTPGQIDVPSKGAADALVNFKDVLLDITKDLYDAFRNFNRESEFAHTFGQAYDRGGAQVALGRTLLEKFDGIGDTYAFDIQGIFNKMAHLESVKRGINPETGKKFTSEEIRRSEEQKQIAALRSQASLANSGNVLAALKGTPEGEKLAEKFVEAVKKAGGSLDFKDAREWLLEYIKSGFALTQAKKVENAQAEALVQLSEKQAQLDDARLPVTARLGDKLVAHANSARQIYQAQAHSLEVQKANGSISENDYELARKKLDVDYEMNRVYEARMATAQAQHALDEQVLQNIGGMLSGIKKLATDGNVWEAIFAPEGATKSERWKKSAEAIRQTLFDTITPIFKTLSDRMTENLFKNITDSLFNSSSLLRTLAGIPELALQKDLNSAEAFSDAGDDVALTISSQFREAGSAVAQEIRDALNDGVGDKDVGDGGDIAGAGGGTASAKKLVRALTKGKTVSAAAQAIFGGGASTASSGLPKEFADAIGASVVWHAANKAATTPDFTGVINPKLSPEMNAQLVNRPVMWGKDVPLTQDMKDALKMRAVQFNMKEPSAVRSLGPVDTQGLPPDIAAGLQPFAVNFAAARAGKVVKGYKGASDRPYGLPFATHSPWANVGDAPLSKSLPISYIDGIGDMDVSGDLAKILARSDAGVAAANAKAKPIADKVAEADAQRALKERYQKYAAIGSLVGNLGGTIAGKGGRYAQQGSSIGSGLGMGAAALIGMQWGAAGGPVGIAVGAALGGILGGFLGGKKDKHDNPSDNPQIRGLEAIEKAQRETITTIQAQTDALLKPENRFLNLPSTFNVPSYNPAFGPGGGGGAGVTNIDKLEINVPVQSNASPAEIQVAVEKAVGKVLGNQRDSQGWN